MSDILFKIYFEAFYWEILLLSLGFSSAPCVGPERVLCEVSSNRWSREVKGQLFIDLNTRYSFNLMLFLVLDGENLAFSQLFWVLKISAKTTILFKISSKLTAKSFFDCSFYAIFTSWMANRASVLLSRDFFPRWVDRLLVVFQFQWIQMHKNLRLDCFGALSLLFWNSSLYWESFESPQFLDLGSNFWSNLKVQKISKNSIFLKKYLILECSVLSPAWIFA